MQQLQDALVSRGKIGQAIGVLIERYGIGEQQAFNFLVRLSLVAMDALDARSTSFRDLLREPDAAPYIDSRQLCAQILTDDRATAVLRTLLTG